MYVIYIHNVYGDSPFPSVDKNWNLREPGVVSPSRLNPRRHFGLTLEGTGALRKCFSVTTKVDSLS